MRVRTPLGFAVAGLCAAVFCVMTMRVALTTVWWDRDFWWGREVMGVRVIALVLSGLSAVTAEALWRPRPWAYRASLSLAAAYAVAVMWMCSGNVNLGGFGSALWVLLPSACVLVPLVAYVRDRSEDLFGTPAPRRPRPVVAAARGQWRPRP